jgi:hypothetical protein
VVTMKQKLMVPIASFFNSYLLIVDAGYKVTYCASSVSLPSSSFVTCLGMSTFSNTLYLTSFSRCSGSHLTLRLIVLVAHKHKKRIMNELLYIVSNSF